MASIRVGIRHGERHSHHICIFGGATIVPIFEDAAHAVADALEAIGLRPTMAANEFLREGTNYIFGAHTITAPAVIAALPMSSVIVNSEPFAQSHQVDIAWNTLAQAINGRHVWDYSIRNLSAMDRFGVRPRTQSWVPLGYAERLRRVARTVDRDIDVLFYGSLNHRRMHVLQQCEERGLRVHAAGQSCFGEARDALLGRSKLLLNIGLVENSVFEQYRVFYVLTNGVPVVTEMAAGEQLGLVYEQGLAIEGYGGLAQRCEALVRDAEKRSALEARAIQAARSIDTTARIREALARHRESTSGVASSGLV